MSRSLTLPLQQLAWNCSSLTLSISHFKVIGLMQRLRLWGSCLLVLCFAAPARADYGDLGLAYLFGYGGFAASGPRSYVPSPPYFALHPPVYYGQRYSRPYGVSPFASWPQLQPAQSYAPRPANWPAAPATCLHCAQPIAETVHADGIVEVAPAEPLEIENPYFQPAPVRYTSSDE